jgi:outer membrane immunogenic protein
MSMKKLLLGTVALAALIAGPATAADLARPAPVYIPAAPVIVPVFTWTGCYAGGNVGGIWARTNWNDTILGDFGTNTASGAIGGLQAGCNFQVGGWVFGLQGDYDWTSATSDSASVLAVVLTDHSHIKSLASVTGRVGYAWDRFLGYVKGGGAWVQSDYGFLVAGVSVATASATNSGWTLGVGGEYAFLNWLTGFLEYDYYDFKNSNASALVCTPAVCGGITAANVGVTTNISVIKAGLNFKFGG